MNNITNSRLTAPGRMDVIEHTLKRDSFFKKNMRGTSRLGQPNRRGKRKRYSALTFSLVQSLASMGLDAVNMRRSEVLAHAYAFTAPKNRRLAA